MKEQLKFEQMELELVNAQRVAEVRAQHDKQLVKLRQQFDDGLSELTSRCEQRLESLEFDLELRRRVEIHEVEERKNQHINDLLENHKKAFSQMKLYYNEITRGNLDLITNLQKHVEELRQRAKNNKRMLLEYIQENQNLSKPLMKVSAKISEVEKDYTDTSSIIISFTIALLMNITLSLIIVSIQLQGLLKERTKDQMALRNAVARLNSVRKKSAMLRESQQQLEEVCCVI